MVRGWQCCYSFQGERNAAEHPPPRCLGWNPAPKRHWKGNAEVIAGQTFGVAQKKEKSGYGYMSIALRILYIN